ncbi:MAG: transcriptional repressor [Saprospiraceae bacterium]
MHIHFDSDQLLHQHQLRKTPVRKEVLDVFLSRSEAVSQQYIEQHFDAIDRVTLYRTLKTFEQKGIIHRAIDGSETIKYALCSDGCHEHAHFDEHAHFHCDDCGKTICLEQIQAPKVLVPNHMRVNSAHLIIKGLCEQCNNA